MIYYTFPETIGIYLNVLLGNARYIRPRHTAKPDYNAVRVKAGTHYGFSYAICSRSMRRVVLVVHVVYVQEM